MLTLMLMSFAVAFVLYQSDLRALSVSAVSGGDRIDIDSLIPALTFMEV